MLLSNSLSEETSPYLLQHKSNPVAWQPWSEDVLALAKQHNKPILLSIGYSACHWCHVMARESFADVETAELMNQHFINIKVDREERPDLDDIYQTAHQLLTGRPGGWPLTVFLCPSTQLPFIAGTYFPKEASYGHVPFKELLRRVNDFYVLQEQEFGSLCAQVKQSYQQLSRVDSVDTEAVALSSAPINVAAQALLNNADHHFGGFGGAPKFPMASNLERLFLAAEEEGELADQARNHLNLSLMMMERGGLHDHIGGGFFRYAVDERWQIPHFEKMLYDNGLLLSLYAEAWSLYKAPEFEKAAAGIVRWATEDMCHPEGAFYCALDADSDGEEGSYYVWSEDALHECLEASEFSLLASLYGVNKEANFEGCWHFNKTNDWKTLISELGFNEVDARSTLLSAQEKLLRVRGGRIAPKRDDKILCSWNALMIRGLSMSARIFNNADYLISAQKAVDFIADKLWINGRLFASWQQGSPKLMAYLDDYVFLMDALLELLQTQWRDQDYRFLIGLAESLSNNFEDKQNGGFYFTAHDHETLIHRSKPYVDGVLPSGNGIAAKVLGRLGHLAAEPRYLESAKRVVQSSWPEIQAQPEAHHNLLLALDELLRSPVQVLLAGGEKLSDWQQQIRDQFGERIHCYWIPQDSKASPPEVMTLDEDQGVVCVGDRCLLPQASLVGLMAQLSAELEGHRSEKG